jgi:hypothetical protein
MALNAVVKYDLYHLRMSRINLKTIQVPKLSNGASGCPTMPCDDTLGLQCSTGICQCSSTYFFDGFQCGNLLFWKQYKIWELTCQSRYKK